MKNYLDTHKTFLFSNVFLPFFLVKVNRYDSHCHYRLRVLFLFISFDWHSSISVKSNFKVGECGCSYHIKSPWSSAQTLNNFSKGVLYHIFSPETPRSKGLWGKEKDWSKNVTLQKYQKAMDQFRRKHVKVGILSIPIYNSKKVQTWTLPCNLDPRLPQ